MKLLLLLPLLALTSSAQEDSLLTIHRIETETADRIQSRVLDPMLGAGQSSVFVKLALEAKRDYEQSDRFGEGRVAKVKVKNEIAISTGTGAQDPDERQEQESRQTKDVKETRLGMSNRYTGFHVAILHDARIPPSKIASVRTALLAVYKWESGVDINFHPVEFNALK